MVGSSLRPVVSIHARKVQVASRSRRQSLPDPKGKPDAATFIGKRSSAVEAKLLEVLAQGWSISKAANAAGIGRITAFRWRDDAKEDRAKLDPKSKTFRADWEASFFTRWEDAMDAGVDVLEDEATRRATGYQEDVFGKDGKVGERTLYSDPLMQMIMKGKRPDRYNPVNKNEHSGPNGTPIPHSVEIEFVSPAAKAKVKKP